jgi:hypothetical protein
MTSNSSSADQVGRHVRLVASDPWDFVAADGSVRFDATVIRAATYNEGADEERLVLQLLEPVSWHGETIEFLVARERHGHGVIDDLSLGHPVECALVAVGRERVHGSDPFDLSWWRGGFAASATVHPL